MQFAVVEAESGVGRFDQGIGAGDQLRKLVLVADDAALCAAPQVPPAKRRPVGPLLAVVSAPPVGALDEDHLGAQRAEDRGAHRTPVVSEVQHPIRLQHRREANARSRPRPTTSLLL